MSATVRPLWGWEKKTLRCTGEVEQAARRENTRYVENSWRSAVVVRCSNGVLRANGFVSGRMHSVELYFIPPKDLGRRLDRLYACFIPTPCRPGCLSPTAQLFCVAQIPTHNSTRFPAVPSRSIEKSSIDLCDPAWSLNPVLAPMPMPNDDDEPAGCEDISNGDGGRESARRRLLVGGRLVSVHSVNPEAQASTPSTSTASAPSPRVHGEAVPFPHTHGHDARAADASVGAGDVASCTKNRRKRSNKCDSGNGSGSGNKETGTDDAGSQKPRRHAATSGKDEFLLFRTSVGFTANNASAGSASPSSRNAPHPTSMAAGEIFPAVREATAPATPKHRKGFRSLVRESPARATFGGTADASGCGFSYVRKVAQYGNRDGGSCSGGRRAGARCRIPATSETASIDVCDVPAVDATAAEFCTPRSNGSEEATPSSGVLVPSAGTCTNAGVPADDSGGGGGGVETTTSATAVGAGAVTDDTPNVKPWQQQRNPSLNCGNDHPSAATCTPALTPAAAPVRAVRAVFRGRSSAGKQHSGVLTNDEDFPPGPAILAELNKGSGNGNKVERSARAPCTCKKCR